MGRRNHGPSEKIGLSEDTYNASAARKTPRGGEGGTVLLRLVRMVDRSETGGGREERQVAIIQKLSK